MVRARLGSRKSNCAKRLLVVVVFECAARSAHAHRLNEYLKATILSIEPGRVRGTLRMVPGVAVASAVLENIDTDHDGTLSQAERDGYARQVLSDLQLNDDGRRLDLHLEAATFPSEQTMKLGTG